MDWGYVYFIQAEANGFIKIGWTDKHPSYRFRELQTAAPCTLVPLGAIRGHRRLEWDLHNRFGHIRSHGEWFRPETDLLAFIEKKVKPWPARGAAYETDSPGEAEYRKRREKWMDEMSQWALMRIRVDGFDDPGHGYLG